MLHFVWFHNCDAHTPIPCSSIYSGQYFRFQTFNRCKLHCDWMIKWQQYWPLRYQQIGMYDVWGYGVVYSGKFKDDYECKNNPWIQHGLHSIIGRVINECMLGWACVCVFHLSWRTSIYISNNPPPPKKKDPLPPFPADTRQNVTMSFWCHNDVIASCAHCVYVMLILILSLAGEWHNADTLQCFVRIMLFFCLFI